jgi:hypothetical protein
MTIEKAKEVLQRTLEGFPFKSEQSLTHALARILSPYGRGLIGFDERLPLWYYGANRPRAGKDYLAGVGQIIYLGEAFEDAALGDDHNETRKRITAALVAGRRMVHFANCQGHIDDQYFIQAITNKIWRDRMLGSTTAKSDLSLVNECEFSLSANMGLTYREDLEGRTRRINIAYYQEDENSRTFPMPYLHQWIKENRSLILSAIASLYDDWIKKGCPAGKTPFTSFPRWAEVVGGLMTATGLGDPCQPHKDLGAFGGNLKEAAMRGLYEHCYAQAPDSWFTKTEIFNAIIDAQQQDDRLNWFGDLEGKDKMHNRTKIGMALNQHQDRELSGITMILDASNQMSQRHRVLFTKDPGKFAP